MTLLMLLGVAPVICFLELQENGAKKLNLFTIHSMEAAPDRDKIFRPQPHSPQNV